MSNWIRRHLLLLLIVAGTALLGSCAFFVITTHSGEAHEDGYSVGTLINVRQEGALWPRPAATLLHTGEMKGDEYAMEPGLFAKALDFADHSQRVRISYANRYVCWAWNYSSCSIITAIDADPITEKMKP